MVTRGDKLAKLMFEANEAIEDKYGSDATVGAMILVADVIAGDEKMINPIMFYSNDPRRWLQLALLEQAATIAQENEDARIAEAED